jgi:ribosome maturation factor RimP
VFIDGEKNITADDCAKVSKQISSRFDFILENYRLDVSSPGTNRPLIYLKQFHKHINRKFEILYADNEQTKSITGKLLEINGDYLVFLSNNKEIMILFNNIKKATVIPAIS